MSRLKAVTCPGVLTHCCRDSGATMRPVGLPALMPELLRHHVASTGLDESLLRSLFDSTILWGSVSTRVYIHTTRRTWKSTPQTAMYPWLLLDFDLCPVSQKLASSIFPCKRLAQEDSQFRLECPFLVFFQKLDDTKVIRQFARPTFSVLAHRARNHESSGMEWRAPDRVPEIEPGRCWSP